MTEETPAPAPTPRWLFPLLFGLLAFYVAARMGVFASYAEVITADAIVQMPNTFASVDHPFHVARADTLWRELSSGRVLRWIGQHQGGYPVEFYPLGEAWLEVAIRALSFGGLQAEGAHSLAVAALFLLPGLAFSAMVKVDRWSPAVALLAFALHISWPGGWYDGGYTELVQWGLVTNVAGAVAAMLMFPALIRFLASGVGSFGAAAAFLAAAAIYCNPRSLVGLVALGAGAWIAAVWSMPRKAITPLPPVPVEQTDRGSHPRGAALHTTISPSLTAVGRAPSGWRFGVRASATPIMTSPGATGKEELRAQSPAVLLRRLLKVALIAALLAAPELLSLARFGHLYTFVRYSTFETISSYVETSIAAVSLPVFVVALLGVLFSVIAKGSIAARATTAALVMYVAFTIMVAFVPWIGELGSQLEPTRLMPLQRMLTIYLAASAAWAALTWLMSRFAAGYRWLPNALAIALVALVVGVQTRSLPGPPPDPASPRVPGVSLYPVATSATAEQVDLEAAVKRADAAALPGTALLVLGSAVSWHQQLWSPLWTRRPLFYDNWLWYWQLNHAGTPDYRAAAGHHYPDPERTLDRAYLTRHGIGAVVVTGAAREAAAASPELRLLQQGVYDTFVVRDPTTTMTFGLENSSASTIENQRMVAEARVGSGPVVARRNWFPRWSAAGDGLAVPITRRDDGYLQTASDAPISRFDAVYAVGTLDWVGRTLAAIGIAGLLMFSIPTKNRRRSLPAWFSARANSQRSDRRENSRERVIAETMC